MNESILCKLDAKKKIVQACMYKTRQHTVYKRWQKKKRKKKKEKKREHD